MKSNFYAAPNLMMLEETLKSHEPYAVINVSTTGLDNSDFDKHMPTRVCVQEYVWNDEIKQYENGLTFDKMVKCGEEALQRALQSDSYDVFANGGIDREKYISGKDVLEQTDFAKKYLDFMESLKNDTMLIANNASFIKTYLDKIECGDSIQNKIDDFKLLDQTHLTREYFAVNEVTSLKFTLEAMRDYLTGTNGDKIIGGNNRIKVINDFVTRHGRDKGILESEMSAHFRMADAQQYQQYVDSGVEKYRNADFEGKLSTLVANNVIFEEAVMNRTEDCHLNRLLDTVTGNNSNKGFTVMQAATTGFNANNAPIQITALAYEFKDGIPVATKKGISFDIQADKRSLQKAIQEADKDSKDKFDAFKYTGIDRNAYLAGDKVLSQEEALKRISEYFKAFPPADYPIITNGTAKGKNISFTQSCLKSLGNLPAFDAIYVDFTQAVKEYCYLAYNSDEYPKNAIIDENKWNERTFGLEDIAKHNGESALDSTKRKCLYVGILAGKLAEQQKELFQDKEINTPDVELFMEDERSYTNIIEMNLSKEPAHEKANSNEFEAGNDVDYIEDEMLESIVDGDYYSKPITEQKEDTKPVLANSRMAEKARTARENAEKHTERSRQPNIVHSVSQNVDVNLLLQVISDQNKTLMEQNRMLMEQNKDFMKIIQEQNQIIRETLGANYEMTSEKFSNRGLQATDKVREKNLSEKQLA